MLLLDLDDKLENMMIKNLTFEEFCSLTVNDTTRQLLVATVRNNTYYIRVQYLSRIFLLSPEETTSDILELPDIDYTKKAKVIKLTNNPRPYGLFMYIDDFDYDLICSVVDSVEDVISFPEYKNELFI